MPYDITKFIASSCQCASPAVHFWCDLNCHSHLLLLPWANFHYLIYVSFLQYVQYDSENSINKKTRGPVHFTIPSTSSIKHQFWQYGYWLLKSLLVSFYYTYITLCKTRWKENRECGRENRSWYEVSRLCCGSGAWSLGYHSQDPGSIPSQSQDLYWINLQWDRASSEYFCYPVTIILLVPHTHSSITNTK